LQFADFCPVLLLALLAGVISDLQGEVFEDVVGIRRPKDR
jgi:hypothetical protein